MSDKTLTDYYLSNISISFYEDIEGSYVVNIDIDGSLFQVNCQTTLDHNYKETADLSCCNESGGDYYDSGLNAFINENYPDEADDIHSLLQADIKRCAEAMLGDNTAEDYFLKNEDITVKLKKPLFGAYYAHNCSIYRYDEVDGDRIIVSCEDSDEPKIDNSIVKYKIFESFDEYKDWHNKQTYGDENQKHLHHGDCSLALRAYKSL
jgi:hypothetical protein